MRADLRRRIKALETETRKARDLSQMTDAELWQIVGICDPRTGEIRTDLTDDELRHEMGRRR